MDNFTNRTFKDWPTPGMGSGMGLTGEVITESQMNEMKKALALEPWMAEFVKGRHSEQEWDDFFAYLQADPIKRLCLRFWSWFAFRR